MGRVLNDTWPHCWGSGEQTQVLGIFVVFKFGPGRCSCSRIRRFRMVFVREAVRA